MPSHGRGVTSIGSATKASKLKEQSKLISYNATTSQQIFSVTSSGDLGATTTEPMPNLVEVENTGDKPIFLMVGYSSYSDDTSVDAAVDYLHVLLQPGTTFEAPVRAVISTAADKTIMFGTAVDNAAPDANEYTDSTADVDSATASGVVSSSSSTVLYLEPYTSAANCTANLFRVNDLIRIRDEVMKVTEIGDKTDLANNKLTV